MNNENSPLLSIVLPTRNEKENILPMVKKLTEVFANTNYNYEIIFADDSTDETESVIKKHGEKDPRIKFVKGPGKGLAPGLIAGFKTAKGKYVGSMDADLQHPPETMPKLLQKALKDNADYVVATRYAKGGSAEGLGELTTFYGIYRRFVSLAMKYFTQILFIPTRKTSDPLGGFFLFRKEIFDKATLDPKGFKILVEMLMRTKHDIVSEVPYTFLVRENDDSKATIAQGIEFFKHLWYIFRTVPEAGRFFKFCIVGGSGVIVNLGILALLVEIFNTPEKPAYIVAVAISILTNYFFNSIFTYSDKKSPDRAESMRRVMYYYVISVAVMFFNFAIFSVSLSYGLHYILSAILGIIAATLLNFFLATKLIWKLSAKV